MSFVISLPAVLASIAFDILIEGTEILLEWDYFLVMGIVCVVGYLTMDLLLRMAKNMSFDKICYILGAITIILASIILAINPTTV